MQANLLTPPRLELGRLIILLIGFFILLLVWIAQLLMRFANVEKDFAPSSGIKAQVETIAESPNPRNSGHESAQTESPGAREGQSLLTSAATGKSRFSRAAIVGACWTGLALCVALFVWQWGVMLAPMVNASGGGIRLPAQFQLAKILAVVMEGSAIMGTTILGWVAVSQIRRSAGKLHGMWLAVFDGLFFPLLLLDVAILTAGWFAYTVEYSAPSAAALSASFSSNVQIRALPFGGAFLLSMIVIVVDWLIIRRVWRAVTGTPTKPVAWLHHLAGFLILSQGVLAAATACGFLAQSSRVAMLLSVGLGLAGISLLAGKDIRKAYDQFNERFTGLRFPAGVITILASLGLMLLQGVYLAVVKPSQRNNQALRSEPQLSSPTHSDFTPRPLPTRLRTISEAPFVAQLPYGGSLELLAVKLSPSTNSPWWQLNGKPSEYDRNLEPEARGNNQQGVVALVRLQWPTNYESWPRQYGAATNRTSARLQAGLNYVRRDGRRVAMEEHSAMYFDNVSGQSEEVTLFLRIATADWQTRVVQKPGLSGWLGSSPGRKNWTFGETPTGDLKVTITGLSESQNEECRLVAVDVDGMEYVPSEFSNTRVSTNPNITFEATFRPTSGSGQAWRLPLSRLREVRWEVRPYDSIEFRHVALKPGHRTAVEIKDYFPADPQFTNDSTSPDLTFGPVVERTLVQKENGELSLIDFDNNQTPPDPVLADSWEGMFAWASSNGVDACVMGHNLGKGELQGLLGWDLRVKSVGSTDWQQMQSGEVVEALESVRLLQTAPMDAKQKFPATFLIQTREGGKGLLQITGFTENPRGVKLRYKLVQNSSPADTDVGKTDLPARSIVFRGANINEVLDAYGYLTKARLEVDPRVKSLGDGISYTNTTDLTRAEAIRELEAVMRDQAGLVFNHRDTNHVVVRYCGLEFRWVAAEGDTDSPVEMLPDASDASGQRTLRVLTDVLLDSSAVASGSLTVDQPDKKELMIVFTPSGAKRFAELTADNVGRQLAIVWHGRVLTAPRIMQSIKGGNAVIAGRFSDAETVQLLRVLNHQKTPKPETTKFPAPPPPKPSVSSNEPANVAQPGSDKLRKHIASANTPSVTPHESTKLPELNGASSKGLRLECRPLKKEFTTDERVGITCRVTNTTDELKPVGWSSTTGAHFCLTPKSQPWFGGIMPKALPRLDGSLTVRDGYPPYSMKIVYLPPGQSVEFHLDCGYYQKPQRFEGRIVYDPVNLRNGYIISKDGDGSPPYANELVESQSFAFEVVAGQEKTK